MKESSRNAILTKSNSHLAVFISNMHSGGAQQSMLRLVKGFANSGYMVDLVLAKAEGEFLYQVPASVRVVDLKARGVLASLPALTRYLRSERPVAMLTALDYVNIVALWARRFASSNVRVVVSERSTPSYSSRYSSNRRGRLLPLLTRYFYRWANAITAVSIGAADDLAKITGIPRDQIKVIYNPVVTPELQEKAREQLTHPWFRPGQPPVVLAVGRLVTAKDYPTLIKSFALVRKRRLARLLILGEGARRQSLEAMVKHLGLQNDVSLPGFVENPYAFMARTSIFVLSSRWEGLPGALIEAMYCGASVISTDCPNGPREILAGGKYGKLIPVGDISGLAQAIEDSLSEEKSAPPPESWHLFKQDTVVEQYVNVLMES